MRINAFGKQCPLPLMMAKKELDANNRELSVAVDNQTAVGNLQRLSHRYDLDTSVEDIEGGFLVSFVEKVPEAAEEIARQGASQADPDAQGSMVPGVDDNANTRMNDEEFDTVINSLIANGVVSDNEVEARADDRGDSKKVEAANADDRGGRPYEGDVVSAPAVVEAPTSKNSPTKQGYTVFIAKSHLGEGDRELGTNLMRMALYTLSELTDPPNNILLMNSGVKLAASFDRQVTDSLKTLEDKGTEILICGACADWYDLKDQIEVGEISNMYEILERMIASEKVITL
jgi:selenium metabolism protein YedF